MQFAKTDGRFANNPSDCRFTNELSNSIHIGVKNDGETNVKITIQGPHSICENTLTRREAQRLRDCLTDFFRSSENNIKIITFPIINYIAVQYTHSGPLTREEATQKAESLREKIDSSCGVQFSGGDPEDYDIITDGHISFGKFDYPIQCPVPAVPFSEMWFNNEQWKFGKDLTGIVFDGCTGCDLRNEIMCEKGLWRDIYFDKGVMQPNIEFKHMFRGCDAKFLDII